MYFVYILQCHDTTLYTGITTDLSRRVKEHNSSSLGAKYTHSRRPCVLVYSKEFTDRSSAQIEEARIKKLSRTEKLTLSSPALPVVTLAKSGQGEIPVGQRGLV